ncbi:methanogenesis marker 17 protein [Methanomassiliicoccus luminyensis]|uniref:methanogenesis marker 17 protein n=1 Tax=Methanomassiliicoccus luminyensis TaxID=1080712 RepID=UPI00036B7DD0|nr:methanogenesis marker 17 protein [Methanomassiliicoccus luminyensis]
MSRQDEGFAYQNFDAIFRSTMADLGVSRMVQAFKILADPEAPYFLISMKLGKPRAAIRIPDMSTLDDNTRGTMITITDEEWAPALLTKLWQRYGRDGVEQLTRFELLVKNVKVSELEKIELDPGEELRTKLLDAVWRVFPEGFKVRHNLVDDKVLTIIGTEHDMKQEWIDIATKVHEEMHHAEAE